MGVSYQCWVWWSQCQTLSWSQALLSLLELETTSLPLLQSLYSTEPGGWHFPLRHAPKDMKELKSSTLPCWHWCFHDEQAFNQAHLAEFSLRLPQSDLVFDHLSLHLLVVGLQCADEMTHLSVDGTLRKACGLSESRKENGGLHAFKSRHCLPACSLAARVCSNSMRSISYSFLTWASVSSSWNTSVRTFLCNATSSFCIQPGRKWGKEKIWQ